MPHPIHHSPQRSVARAAPDRCHSATCYNQARRGMMIHLTLHWRTPHWGLRHQLMTVLWVTLLVLAMGSAIGSGVYVLTARSPSTPTSARSSTVAPPRAWVDAHPVPAPGPPPVSDSFNGTADQ